MKPSREDWFIMFENFPGVYSPRANSNYPIAPCIAATTLSWAP